MDVVVVVEIT